MGRRLRNWRSVVRKLRRSPHTPGLLDRLPLYQQVMPDTLGGLVVMPLVLTFVGSLLPGLVLCSVIVGGFGFEAIVGALVIAAIAALVVGLVAAEGFDRYIQRPVEDLPPTAASDRVRLCWPDARVLDREAYLANIDEVVVENMGWTEENVLQLRWRTLMPMAFVLAREFAAVDADTGRLIGGAGYSPDARDPTARSIGCWVGPVHRGKGYGAEILRLMVDHAGRWHQGPLSLLTRQDNVAMRHLAVAAGGEEVEQFDHVLPNGNEVPSVRYLFPGPAQG